jgi:hypothetical protein
MYWRKYMENNLSPCRATSMTMICFASLNSLLQYSVFKVSEVSRIVKNASGQVYRLHGLCAWKQEAVDVTNIWCGCQWFWNQYLVRWSRFRYFIFKFCTQQTLNKSRILVKPSRNRFCLMRLLMIKHVETSGVVFKAGRLPFVYQEPYNHGNVPQREVVTEVHVFRVGVY